MRTLYFHKGKWQVYNAIKWNAENSENEDTKFVCNALLQQGKPSAFGYMLKNLNEYYLEHLNYAMTQYICTLLIDREQ